jgi:hypothetical protein
MSEPIKVFAYLWIDDNVLNCDLFRNVPALVASLESNWGVHPEDARELALAALEEPGEPIIFDSGNAIIRYCTVADI